MFPAMPSNVRPTSVHNADDFMSSRTDASGSPANLLQRVVFYFLIWITLASVILGIIYPAGRSIQPASIAKQAPGAKLTIPETSLLTSGVPSTTNQPLQAWASATPNGTSISDKTAAPDYTSGGSPSSISQPALASTVTGQQGMNSAYSSDINLGNGQHQAAISSTPLNYQAKDGSWQPIDPRFQPASGGFTNLSNLLQISAGGNQASLRLKFEGSPVGWEPQSLVINAISGGQTLIASPLDPQSATPGTLLNGGSTIHYANSWTMAGLQEEVSAAPGQAEQRLILSAPPQAGKGSAASGASLAFNAILHLMPGDSLVLAGKSQSAAFSTSNVVEIHDADGKPVLALDPPKAYEQSHPENQVAGRYRFTPLQNDQWQVAVETPLFWWLAPGRNYPAVLDPTMEVIRPVSAATVFKNTPCGNTNDTDSKVYVGVDSECGPMRALVLFNQLPSLPPGYTIQKAELVASPDFGLVTVNSNNTEYAVSTVYANLYPVTSSWGSTVSWGTQPSIGAQIGRTELFFYKTLFSKHGPEEYYPARWILQNGSSGLVSNWLNGSAHNYGLELRASNENPAHCKQFDFLDCQWSTIPTNINWTNQDEQNFQKPDSAWTTTQAGGFALLITYTAPQLSDGIPYTYNPLPDLPSAGKQYAFTSHQYGLPSNSSTWTGVGVKGLHKVISGTQTLVVSAGNLGISQVCSESASSCSPHTSNGSFPSAPNFFMIQGNPSTYGYQAQVQPPNASDPANAILDTYVIEADSSSSLGPSDPTFNPNTTITYTFNISTSHILKVFNLNLVNNSRVAIQVNASAINPISESSQSQPVEAYAFKPGSAGAVSAKNNGILVGGNDASGQPLNASKLTLQQGEGGIWALVVAYDGDVNTVFDDPPAITPTPINATIQVVVHACASNAIPTAKGCTVVQKPDSTTPYKDVGPFRIFSEAGFDAYGSNNCLSEFCTRTALNGNQYAPFIVWRTNWTSGTTDRAVAVVEDNIYLNVSGSSLYTGNGELWLEHFQGSSPDKMLQIGRGYFSNDPNTNLLLPSGVSYAGLPLDGNDASNVEVVVNVQNESAQGNAPIIRQIETTPGTLTQFNFDIAWTVYAEGYGSVSPDVANTAGATQATVSSLNLRFGPSWFVDLDPSLPPNGRFTNLRNYGKIVQPAEMGGAWQDVQAVVLPSGMNLPGPDPNGSPCNGNCMDLRAMDDTLANPDRNWKLPDITLTGAANTVMFSQPGNLTVFSTDQPNATDATTVPFSFRTFQGSVTVDQEPCPGSSNPQKVSVIKGNTKIAMPGLGSDTDPGTEIAASFTLCETALRQVSLTFNGPPTIPVGTTGLLISMINGNVLIGPSNTRIQINVNYHDDGGSVVTGTASVTIDTAGLFDIQAHGKVVAQVDYQGHAWVAWNPLDVGVDVSASYHNWLTGKVHAHLWKGQGWQHRYNWLPDDSATHFAGSISAQIKIDKGQAFSFWFIDIPPFDVNFGIEVAFGQFCSNSSCSAYEWGVKGKFTIVGYDVGVYYGFDSGFDFILGSDGHVLIDQYKSTSAADATQLASLGLSAKPLSNGKPAAIQRFAVADPNAPNVTQPLTVTAYTGSFLAGLTWAHGSPQLTLIRPDSVEITASNAASYGVQVQDTSNSRLYGVQNPMPGTWQAKISGANSIDDYHVLFLANKKVPAIQFNAPTTPGETLTSNETTYKIQWEPPADLPSAVDLRVSLYYTVTASTALTTTQQYGGVIRENLPISQGEYDWDLSYLAKGTYHVYARVYSGQPGDNGIQPAPTTYGSDQVPGYQQVAAPGTIVLQDNTGPVTPNNWTVTLTPLDEAYMACWPPLPAHDLSGYLVAYASPDVDGALQLHEYRIPATVQYASGPDAPQQCTRIGGLNANNTIYMQVEAYDHSGNLSSASALVSGTPIAYIPDSAPNPGTLSGSVGNNYQVSLNWTGAGTLPSGSGYKLFYAQETPAGPGQPGSGANAGDSPIDVGDTTSTVVQGLQPGYFYHFAIQTYYNDGRLSTLSNDLVLLLTNGVDANHDGLPDDWENAHNLSDPNADPDGDGLTNQQEFNLGTNPHLADTDGDGFSDGQEVAGGSDPLDPSSTPLTPETITANSLPPDLSLDKTHLTFFAYRSGPNPPGQMVSITNTGAGSLSPSATSSASWLDLTLSNDQLQVDINKNGLTPGHYSAIINLSGAPGSMTQDSPQKISVDLWLVEGNPNGVPLFLPLVPKGP